MPARPYLLSLALLTLLACKKQQQKFTLSPSDTFRIAQPYSFHTPLDLSAELPGAWMRSNDSCLIHFSFGKKSFDDTICLGTRFPDENVDFFVSEREVWLYSDAEQTAAVYNRSNHKTDFYPYSHDSDELYFFTPQRPARHAGQLAFVSPANMLLPQDNARYYSRPILACAKPEGGKLVVTRRFGNFPEAYRKSMYDETAPVVAEHGGGWAYAFSERPVIYTVENGAPSSHPVSGLPSNRFGPVNPDSVIKKSYNLKVALASDYYHALLYDPASKSYLLFQNRAMAVDAQSLEVPEYEDKPFTVYCIDSSYRVIAQRDFPHLGTYVLIRAVYSNGILYLPKESARRPATLEIETYVLSPH